MDGWREGGMIVGNTRRRYRRNRKKRQEGISPFYILALSVVVLTVAGVAIKKGNFHRDRGADASFTKYMSSLGEGNYENQAVSSAAKWASGSNNGKLNTSVDANARDRFTEIYGDGDDNVTVMIYMCGSDLEAEYGMASADIQEMVEAEVGDKVNVLLYTGGSDNWDYGGISAQYNQLYKIEGGKLNLVESNMGNKSMTNQSTLSAFIAYCKKNYPANRNDLIFWDHGGGSLSGFGYDVKNNGRGAMTVSGIAQAVKSSGITLDFIGFDTGMMATYENAMVLSEYADYMIASEDTGTSAGWNYKEWLQALSEDPAVPTIELGKMICDDYIDAAAENCPGQKATISVTDLAEMSWNAPEKISAFSTGLKELIAANGFRQVSLARAAAREFAVDVQADQVDLIHLTKLINSTESQDLANVVLGAVKYNAVSDNMTNAYGLSIYFPYHDLENVDRAMSLYDTLGVAEEYSGCIREFAGLMASGQVANGGTKFANPAYALLGSLEGYSGVYDYKNFESGISSGDQDRILQMLNDFVKNNSNKEGKNYLSARSVNNNQAAEYISGNYFDPKALIWTEGEKEGTFLTLPEEQWHLIQDVSLNVYYNDGTGYIDLGMDQIYDFDKNGSLKAAFDRTWIYINDQLVPYYYMNTMGEGNDRVVTGYVPAFLNGEKIHLILSFDADHPDGHMAGAIKVYDADTTDTRAKPIITLHEGDLLDFTGHYYDYEGNYQESYAIGEQISIKGELEIRRAEIGGSHAVALYRLTDIYGQTYWTPRIR